MNRIDRLLSMLSVLQTRQIITVDQLANHFRISTGKVYNDIVALQKLNILVQFNAHSGCLSLKGRLIPIVNFTKEEADALIQLSSSGCHEQGSPEGKGQESLERAKEIAPLECALKKIADVLKEQQHSKTFQVYSQDKLIIPASMKNDLF